MNIATIVILVLLASAVWAAIRMARWNKCSSCEGCSCECSKRVK